MPASLGYGVVDYDGSDHDEYSKIRQELNPVINLSTPGGVLNSHMYIQLNKRQLKRWQQNKALEFGDWRCGNGYTVIYPGHEEELPKLLTTTNAYHNFEIIELQLQKKTKKKKKAKAMDKPKKMNIYLPKGMDEAEEIMWMLEQHGLKPEFNRYRNKFFLNREPVEEYWLSHLRISFNNIFKRKCMINDEPVIKPVKIGRDAWKDCFRAIMYRTQCDPLGDWMRAQTHPDIQTLEQAEEYAAKWFHELFNVVGGETELSRYLSKLIIVGPIARRRYPGIIIKHYPVIAGPSNCGKTALVENLLPPEFADYIQPRLNLKKPADDLIYDVAGMGVVELNEMGNTRKAEANHIKGWLSEGTYKGRLKYAEHSTQLPFTHFIIGTANLDDAPLPSDPVAAERFFVQEVGTWPHDPNTKIGLVEDYMEKNRTKLIATGNVIMDSWETGETEAANRKFVQHKLRTIPPELRVGHEKRAQEYSYNPYKEVEMKVWEWLINDPKAPKKTPEGYDCWASSDISDQVPEFKAIRSSAEKAKILTDLKFLKVKLSKGAWRNHNVYLKTPELSDRIKEAQSDQNLTRAGATQTWEEAFNTAV